MAAGRRPPAAACGGLAVLASSGKFALELGELLFRRSFDIDEVVS